MADKPPLPSRFGDPRKQDDKRHICRQFLWGKCTKFGECRYRHELDIREMQKTLKFCRDFQNRVGCNGKDCTYLHTTKEEQKLFYDSGVMPQVLRERHAALAALASNTNMALFNSPAAVPQQNTGYQRPSIELSPDSIAMPPPVPPPPREQSQNFNAQIIAQPPPPPPPPVPPPREQPAQNFNTQIIAQPPPPPPPPVTQYQISVPSSSHNTNVQAMTNGTQTFTVYTAPQQPQQQGSKPLNEMPLGFDASRPPPVLSQQFSPVTGSKRKWADIQIDAGTGKTAKADETQLCKSCLELDKSTNELKAEIDKIIDKEAKFNFALSKKTEEYELKRQYLFSLIGPEYQKAVSALIEASGNGTVPTQAWLQLMECVLNNNAIRSPVNIVNTDDNRITHLTRRVTSNAFAPQPAEPNNDVSSISNVLRSACMMNSSSSEEIEQELRDIVRNLNIPRQQQQVRPNVQAMPNDASRNLNYVSLECLVSRDAGVGFERGGVVAPMRPPAPSLRYSTYQSTLPPPTTATYSPVTYSSQTPNVVIQQPALAAPSPQVHNTTDSTSTQGITQNNYNQYVNSRYNMANYQTKQYP